MKKKTFAALEAPSLIRRMNPPLKRLSTTQLPLGPFFGSKNTWQLISRRNGPTKKHPPFFFGGGAPPKKTQCQTKISLTNENFEPKNAGVFWVFGLVFGNPSKLNTWRIYLPISKKINIHTLDWGKPTSFLETKQTYTTFSQSENLKTAEYMQKLYDI